MYRIDKSTHIQSLIGTQKDIFTTADLAVLWSIKNKITLWTTVKRYVKSGALYKIQKGLYSKLPIDKLNKKAIGCAVGGPFSYVSMETILQEQGVIMQMGSAITVATSKTKKITINGQNYICRALKPNVLLNRTGIIEQGGFALATKERAFADLTYISPKYYIDNPHALDTEKLAEIKKEVGYRDNTK